MIYRNITKDNIKISQLGFGVMRLPLINNDYSQIDEEKSEPMIRYAIEHGINYFDTAIPYHGKGMESIGMSETFLGKVLADGLREKVYIATKSPSAMLRVPADLDSFLQLQLYRLQTDYIDFYLLHSLDQEFWDKYKAFDFASFLDRAKATGKIRYTGFSYHGDNLEQFKEIIDAYDWDICQIQYNYMDIDYCPGFEGIRYAESKGIDIVIMEPLKGNTLANGLPEAAVDIFKAHSPMLTPAGWSLRWLWNHPQIKVILSGMSTMEHLAENIQTASAATANGMSDDELEAIDKSRTIIKERIGVDCTSCNYCMPCPYGVDIPKCFFYYNRLFQFDKERAKRQERMQYTFGVSDEKQAKNCISCGVCESHCPQKINISEQMPKAAQLLKSKEE